MNRGKAGKMIMQYAAIMSAPLYRIISYCRESAWKAHGWSESGGVHICICIIPADERIDSQHQELVRNLNSDLVDPSPERVSLVAH